MASSYSRFLILIKRVDSLLVIRVIAMCLAVAVCRVGGDVTAPLLTVPARVWRSTMLSNAISA
jgi:hypothetical protein